MADAITVKQLANQAGTDPRTLRRILRSQFPRETKGEAYEWQPDDPQIELIIRAVENYKTKPKAEKPAKAKGKSKPKTQPKSKSEK